MKMGNAMTEKVYTGSLLGPLGPCVTFVDYLGTCTVTLWHTSLDASRRGLV